MKERLESFNEFGLSLMFDEQTHTYTLEGREFTSVTRLVSTMYEPFDGEKIAGFCSNAWKMDKDDILAMWKNNGMFAAAFGTAMHGFMENYALYGTRSLPKMPILRQVVESYPWNSDLRVFAEVFITDSERMVCGMCDRLEVVDGIHKVCDYKFNFGCEEEKKNQKNLLLPYLPPSKLTKYQCQMSIYADMLDKYGVKTAPTVRADVWDGTWNHYEMERIPGILDMVLKKNRKTC